MILKQAGGLHRALTWRYMLVTTVAMLVVELLVLVVLTRLAPPYTFGMQPDVYLMNSLARTARAYLLSDDLPGLNAWLSDLRQPVINVTFDNNWLRLNLATFPLRAEQTVLIFREGDGVLAATPPNSPFSHIRRVEDLPGPLSSDLLRSVPPRPGNNIVTTRRDSQVLSVSPIQRDDGALLALFIVLNLASEQPPSAADVVLLAGSSLLVLAGITTMLGGGFGFLASRFVVRRLHALVGTTARWGVGDFSQPVRDDTARDEIAAMAHHLNRLRTQLEELMIMREQLAVLEERSRFARELHDSVKQQVFTLRMNLATIEILFAQERAAAALPHLHKTISLAQHIQDELTLMIHMFRDESASSAPLARRLHDLAADWTQQTSITIALYIDIEQEPVLRVGHAVYRVAQEALSNIHKHSGAQTVSLSLRTAPDTLRLVITDDGCGFDPTQIIPGIGLVSMRERVEALGGSLTIDSSAEGTRLEAQLRTGGTD